MPRPPGDAPDRILDAAFAILKASGPAALSFDRVARDCGLSKGGVLHHFHTRKALVSALLRRCLDDIDARIAARMAADDQRIGAFRRAWTATLLSAAERRTSVALLAAVVIDPPSAAAAWSWLDRARLRLAAEVGAAEALVLSSAVEAWWLGAAMGRPGLDGQARLTLVERLGS